jgi:hypothetical protein
LTLDGGNAYYYSFASRIQGDFSLIEGNGNDLITVANNSGPGANVGGNVSLVYGNGNDTTSAGPGPLAVHTFGTTTKT